ncbi:hypothetical protein [Nostoc sp. UHCC 0870]|uniref:hypothetical protein n=1 Tax=Nostoc sp. UHCC 0870 TaxID=2914041 RepID=UPI0030DDCCB4
MSQVIIVCHHCLSSTKTWVATAMTTHNSALLTQHYYVMSVNVESGDYCLSSTKTWVATALTTHNSALLTQHYYGR